MKFIDIHEDLQTYFRFPDLIGYDSAYVPPALSESSTTRHADIPAYKKVGTELVVVTIFPYKISQNQIVPDELKVISEQVGWYKEMLARYEDFFHVTDSESLAYSRKNKKIGFLIHCEGLGPAVTPADVKMLQKLGVCSVGLSWNEENNLCSTCESIVDVGLKSGGREVIKSLIDNNLILDLTHSSFKTQDDVLNEFDYNRIFFSHTCSYSVYPFSQNIKAHVAEELIKRSGLIGVSFLDLMVNGRGNSKLNNFINHLSELNKYAEVLAIGSDFFGFEMGNGIAEINTLADLPLLADEINNLFGKAFVDKLFYSNALKFFERVL